MNLCVSNWAESDAVAFNDPSRTVSYGKWRALITAASDYFADKSPTEYLLFDEDSFNFSILFFGLLVAGKKVILPPNNLPETIELCHSNSTEPFSDSTHNKAFIQALSATCPSRHLTIEPEVTIQFFTSGSSGQPKAINKSVAQLFSEVEALHLLWPTARHTQILATVSHQHIYGLLFRLLWPLRAGNTCQSSLIEYPENLIQQCMQSSANVVVISSPAFIRRLELEDLQQLAKSPAVIDYWMSSGGPLSYEASFQVTQNLNLTPFEILGSTETGGIGYRQQFSPNFDWTAFSGVRIQQGENQRLMIQSKYLESPSDWYLCDDRVEIMGASSFTLLGRADRIVKIEEKRVSLDEIEQRLSEHEFVKECKVLQLTGKRSVLGAVIIMTAQGANVLEMRGKRWLNKEFKHYLAQRFEPVTLPRKWRFPSALPYNSQGKLTTKVLTELFINDSTS